MDSTLGFARAITARRSALGMKRKGLAAAAALSYPYIAEIENGKKVPSLASQKKIAAALEWSVADLHAAAEGPVGVIPVRKAIAGEPTIADLMTEVRALRRLVEELAGRL